MCSDRLIKLLVSDWLISNSATVRLKNNILVWGSGYHHYNIAVLVFSKEFLQKKFPTKAGSVESLIQDDEVLAWVHAEMEQYGRSEGLKGFEIPKRIIMEQIPFTVRSPVRKPKGSKKEMTVCSGR